MTDDYAMSLLDYAKRAAVVTANTRFYRTWDPEHLPDMLEKVMAELANRPDPAEWIEKHGDRVYVGGRRLFKVYREAYTAHSFSDRLRDEDSKKVIERVMARRAALASVAEARKPQGTARIGVVPVLELQDMLHIVETLRALIDQIDRSSMVFRDVKGQFHAAELAAIFSSLDDPRQYEVTDGASGPTGEYITVHSMDAADRERVELIDSYLGNATLNPSKVVLRLVQLFVAIRETYVRYIKVSLKQYR